MKYIQRKTVLLGSVLGVAVGLFAGALVLGERLSPPVSGLCFGVAGILGGVAGSRLIMARVERNWTPEERKEIERGERDERNVTIREKAAYSSWYWSLYLLWGLWLLTLVTQGGMYVAFVSAAIVLHCIFTWSMSGAGPGGCDPPGSRWFLLREETGKDKKEEELRCNIRRNTISPGGDAVGGG